MEPEQRGQPGTGSGHQQTNWKNAQEQRKTYAISREEVETAWRRVRAKGGTGGVDGESIKSFEKKLDSNLYKLWNRMASGSYHPKAVRRVEIPKGNGKTRPLGIPTITDRIAQEIVRARFEPVVERFFHPDSYGYRPNRSAVQAVGTCRKRCWKYDWVLDVDIQKFFDTIDHTLMMKAVTKYSPEPWMTLYIQRWLTAPVALPDGTTAENKTGTPQGGVISPLLANLYLHFTFDVWMGRTFPGVEFERYADDIIIHCESQEQSKAIQQALAARLQECGLTLHPEKTKLVYCRDNRRKGRYPTKKFTFLGYTFQPREARSTGMKETFTGFLPAAGTSAQKEFRLTLKRQKLFLQTRWSLAELAAALNPRVRGWFQYFGHFYRSALSMMVDWLDRRLAAWLRRKYRLSHQAAFRFLRRLVRQNRQRFVHWTLALPGRAV